MSQRESGYERKDRDLYETPEWVTQALIDHFTFSRSVWEPAAGSGKMSNILKKASYNVVETDIHPLNEEITKLDFLNCERLPDNTWAIITNPPYKHATEFIEKALDLTGNVGKVAMLLRTDFDHAKSRFHLFRDHPAFACKLVLTKRIVWFEPKKGEKGKSPSFNHAWYVWDWQRDKGPPILKYE